MIRLTTLRYILWGEMMSPLPARRGGGGLGLYLRSPRGTKRQDRVEGAGGNRASEGCRRGLSGTGSTEMDGQIVVVVADVQIRFGLDQGVAHTRKPLFNAQMQRDLLLLVLAVQLGHDVLSRPRIGPLQECLPRAVFDTKPKTKHSRTPSHTNFNMCHLTPTAVS